MMDLLIRIMYYLLFAHSIDNIGKKETIKRYALGVQNITPEDEKDFNYNDLSTEKISDKNMPNVNCNRRVFCNSEIDWIDLLKSNNIDLNKEIIEKRHILFSRILFIKRVIRKLVSNKIDNNRDLIMLHRCTNIENELLNLSDKIEHTIQTGAVLNKNSAYNFLQKTELYFCKLSNVDLFNLFFWEKPSILLDKCFSEEDIKISEFRQFIDSIYIIYDRVQTFIIKHISDEFLGIKNNELFISCSCLLKGCMLIKWSILIEKSYITNITKNVERFNHMLVYSINADSILVEKLTNIIKSVVDAKKDKEFESLGLKKIIEPNLTNCFKALNLYELKLNNNKSYVINIFDLEKNCYTPPGLSTAYLDFRGGYESLGFMGITRVLKNDFKYLFLSVEEKQSFYITTHNLDVFKNNITQTFYFLLYILELLSSLYVHRIELISHLSFAVDNTNEKEWKFKLNDAGYYRCYKNECIYRNHKCIVLIIDIFLKLFVDQTLLKFLIMLKRVANNLKNTDNKDYYIILITLVKDELEDLKENLEPIDINKTQCTIQ